MNRLGNVHLASVDQEDEYAGFNDYNPILSEDALVDPSFQQAVARTSHGRRPTTGLRTGTAQPLQRGGTAAVARGQTALRAGTSAGAAAMGARPMTAVRGAGYTSAGRNTASPMDRLSSGSPVVELRKEESPEEKCKQIEKRVNELLQESIHAYEAGNMKGALDKAKEAGKKERTVVKLREQLSTIDQMNLDLTFTVLFNLAHQYTSNGLYNEALNTYQVIVKNKAFANAGRLKINIGNIYFKKKDYMKAIKYYRMALDQVPTAHKVLRLKILNNIGVAFVRMGKYDEALSTFEHCVEEHRKNYKAALNLILCAFTVGDKDRMRDAFIRLLGMTPRRQSKTAKTRLCRAATIRTTTQSIIDYSSHPTVVDTPAPEQDSEDTALSGSDDPHDHVVQQAIANDALRQWQRNNARDAEAAILTAARLISPAIAATFADGYAWCVEQIKQSAHADIASDLEINKAIQYLRQRDITAAIEVLNAFEKKESKVASAASNNLSFLYFMQRDYDSATKYADRAIEADRYNPDALVNRGNICAAKMDYDMAREFYKRALTNEASCVEALYNLGLSSKVLGKMEEALDCFGKLHTILRNNVQVMCQIGLIYEALEDKTSALEWFSLAQNMAPTDPGILAKLGQLYNDENDKPQAFQCYYDSYRYFPSNMAVIEYLGAYYIDAQFPEKAVNYFEKAALIQPTQVKWQLMVASCHRRSGNYQKAIETYKSIHRRFPDNVECLKFLVRLATDLALPDVKEYQEKLKRAERVRQLRDQRAAGEGTGSHSAMVGSTRVISAGNSGGRGNLTSQRSTHSATSKISMTDFDPDAPYVMSHQQPIDTSYSLNIQKPAQRPMTAARARGEIEAARFDDEEIGDDLLPD